MHNDNWDTATPWTVLRHEVRERFRWLKQYNEAHTPEGTCEIAGLFVPWSRPPNGPTNTPTGGTMFFSTVPRGEWGGNIRNDLENGVEQANGMITWWADTAVLLRAQTWGFHAPDGVYHMLQLAAVGDDRFSTFRGSAGAGRARQGGLRMVIWGYKFRSDPNIGRLIEPCVSESSLRPPRMVCKHVMQPTCGMVAASLGVEVCTEAALRTNTAPGPGAGSSSTPPRTPSQPMPQRQGGGQPTQAAGSRQQAPSGGVASATLTGPDVHRRQGQGLPPQSQRSAVGQVSSNPRRTNRYVATNQLGGVQQARVRRAGGEE